APSVGCRRASAAPPASAAVGTEPLPPDRLELLLVTANGDHAPAVRHQEPAHGGADRPATPGDDGGAHRRVQCAPRYAACSACSSSSWPSFATSSMRPPSIT